MQQLKDLYEKKVRPGLMKELGYQNPMAAPAIVKVTINTSFGKEAVTKGAGEREKMHQNVLNDISLISGQRPRLTQAKKSIAGFKLRQNMEIGAMATLRGQRMWDFLERLITLSFPKSRDFRGIDPKSVDKQGNLNIGFREHINFPEIFAEKEKTIFGLQVTVTTTAGSHEKGLALLRALGFPFRD